MHQELRTLAYRLPERVAYHQLGGSFQLVLNFPLKAIGLHSSWKAVFDLLSKGDFVPIETIVPLVEPADPDKVETFLDDLVRKGFLERDGLSTLSEYPFISIIIPVRNRPEEIDICLSSLGQLHYPRDRMEIIVVDDASDDHTPDVASEFEVSLIRLKEHKQASYCRNLAAEGAKGDILAFIDSDCLADPLWLRELVPAFKERSIGAVGGMVDSYFGKKGLDRYEKVKSSLNVCTYFRRSGEDDLFFYVPSCNLLVRRDLLLKLGGFREEMHVGEDVDLCWRLQDAGHHVEFRPQGRVSHRHRNRLWPFCRRRFDYGTSEPLLQQMHSKRKKRLIFPPGASSFWSVAVLAIFLGYAPLFVLCGITVLFDAQWRLSSIRQRGISIKLRPLFLSVLRSYLALFYHCCAFVSRYYLFWAIVVMPLFPLASIIIMGMHLLAGLVEYFIKRPRLNLASFFFYFSLEQLSYQLGVWWGCIKNLSFSAVNPRLAWRISPESS